MTPDEARAKAEKIIRAEFQKHQTDGVLNDLLSAVARSLLLAQAEGVDFSAKFAASFSLPVFAALREHAAALRRAAEEIK